MQCPFCSQDHPDDSRFCPVTGRDLRAGAQCPHCGSPVEAHWLHCGHCGGRLAQAVGILEAPAPSKPARRSPVSAAVILLALVSAAGALLAVGTILFIALRPADRAGQQMPGLTPVPAQATPAGASGAAGRIVFESGRDGNLEIYVMNEDGSSPTRLTQDPAEDSQPAWSPDGAQIAFASNRNGDYEIYVMDADGSRPRRLTFSPGDDTHPAWSPDGMRLAFASTRDGNREIYVMNADGSDPLRLTEHAADDGHPGWSADGRRLVFESARSGNLEIHVMNADGSNPQRLTDAPQADGIPAWAPDGLRIAFTTDRDGNGEIYVVSADGSALVRLTSNASADAYPAWSPDGTWIVFDSSRDGNNEIYRMRSDGSIPTRLTWNDQYDGCPDWFGARADPGNPNAAASAVPIPADEQDRAQKVFDSGFDVYLYDPQPASVRLSELDTTLIRLRTILSPSAKPVPNVVYILKFDDQGNDEYLVLDRGYLEDWTSQTGEISFSVFNLMSAQNRRQYSYAPDTWVVQAVIGMTFLYGALNQDYVDAPAYLEVFLLAPEERADGLWLSDLSRKLSNSVRIEVIP